MDPRHTYSEYESTDSHFIPPMKGNTSVRNIIAVGVQGWKDRRTTAEAFRRIAETYKGPYTVHCDTGTGAGRFAAALGRELGWTVNAQDVDPAKCAPECPQGHRRPGGSTGDWCPTARHRWFTQQLDHADLVIGLVNDTNARFGQVEAAKRGIAVWQYTPRGGTK